MAYHGSSTFGSASGLVLELSFSRADDDVVSNVLVSGFLVWRVRRAETGGRLCLDEGAILYVGAIVKRRG